MHYHISRVEEAHEILADLHGKGDLHNELVLLELEEIKGQVEFERTEGAKSYLDLLKPGIFRRVSIGASLQMWSQLSGMNIMKREGQKASALVGDFTRVFGHNV